MANPEQAKRALAVLTKPAVRTSAWKARCGARLASILGSNGRPRWRSRKRQAIASDASRRGARDTIDARACRGDRSCGAAADGGPARTGAGCDQPGRRTRPQRGAGVDRDAHIAGFLNNQSSRLGDLGRREEALAASSEAVAIYRRLAKERPDAFLPDLAMSLNNQSGRLTRAGAARGGAGGERGGRRDPAAARGHAAGCVPHELAMSLNNRSVQLSDVGRREEALAASEEAVAIWRRLAKAAPGCVPARPRDVAEQPDGMPE